MVRCRRIEVGRSLEEADLEDGAVRDRTRVSVDALGTSGSAGRHLLRSSHPAGHTELPVLRSPILPPLHLLLESVGLVATSARSLADNVIRDFEVDEDRCRYLLERNVTLVMALTPRVGYEVTASIAAESIQSGRSVLEVAMESTEIAEDQLRELPDARRLTGGGRDMSSRPHT